jgi:branched-chain amino acid transport system substrate-binding protein
MSVFAKAKASRSRALKSTISGIAILGVSALLLSACASSGSTTTGGKDLSLKIGSILPQTGTLAVLGPPEIAGVDLAVQDINAAKAGLTISVTHKDSGDTSTDIATQSATALLASGVSVIVGAASSGVSKTIIDQITKANVIEISGANTSPDFSNYPDNGYYWRTAPSDVLQGRILGNKILKDGATKVAILYMNDAYGTGLESNVKKSLVAGGATIAGEEIFEPASTDFNSALTSLLATKPDALVVISFDEIKTIAEQLAAKGFDFKKFYGTDGNYGVITKKDTNVDIAGAQFSSPGVEATKPFQANLQALVKKQGGSELTVFSYAAESYDAVIVSALAALQGGKTDGATIKANLQSVSEKGTKCTTYADCAKLIADKKDINYDGLSGPITFDKNGDPTEAYVSIYKYGTGNVDTFEQQVYGKL